MPTINVFNAADKRLIAEEVTATTADEQKGHAMQALAARRYEVETAGVETPWGTAQTDKVSQSALIGTMVAIQSGLREDGAVWKFKEGPVALTNAEMLQVCGSVFAHVQNAFNREAEIAAMIDVDPSVNWTW